VPDKEETSRLEKIKKNEDVDLDNILPDVDCYEYLLNWLSEAGFSMSGGMGEVPLSFQEIWAFGFKYDITKFEMDMIRSLSERFVAGKQKYKNQFYPQPYRREITEDERKQVADKIKAIFDRRMKKA
jgi:hypothetical protein